MRDDDDGTVTFDQISEDLQELRSRADSPSYSELVRRVTDLRVARGVPPEQARPARSTLYDAFRPGRRRMDVQLVADLAQALGEDEAAVEAWRSRCRRAVPDSPADVPAGSSTDVPADVPAGSSADGGTGSGTEAPATATPAAPGERSLREPDQPEQPDQPDQPDQPEQVTAPRRSSVAGVLILALAANLVGRSVVEWFGLTIYLDMVGTAVASIVLGPWWGVLVGVTTNVAAIPISGPESLTFALVQVAGALVWGYGVRRFAMGRNIVRYLCLNLLVALTCTSIAAPILMAYDADVGHGSENIIALVRDHTGNLASAVLSANILTSVFDKLISGFVALAAAEALRRRFPEAHRRVAPAAHLLQPMDTVADSRTTISRTTAGEGEPSAG